MIERIPEDIPDLPEDAERRAAQEAFREVFIDLGLWEREGRGQGRSALILLGQMIHVSVETESQKRLTARLRHFLENEAVRRDFCESLGLSEEKPLERVNHGEKASTRRL
jgi:hypothetical protein